MLVITDRELCSGCAKGQYINWPIHNCSGTLLLNFDVEPGAECQCPCQIKALKEADYARK